MKQIAILILTVLGSIHANAQNSALDSTEMNELMEIIKLQQKIETPISTLTFPMSYLIGIQTPYQVYLRLSYPQGRRNPYPRQSLWQQAFLLFRVGPAQLIETNANIPY